MIIKIRHVRVGYLIVVRHVLLPNQRSHTQHWLNAGTPEHLIDASLAL